MNRLTSLTLMTLLLTTFPVSADDLKTGFQNPPETTKPYCYWYWLNGDITKDGITRDLEAMARAGIKQAMLGNIEGGGPVKMFSPEWYALTRHALKEASRVGVGIMMFNAPGWSQSGGPWVKPEQSMRRIDWNEVEAKGGRFSQVVRPADKPNIQDVAVLAIPRREAVSIHGSVPPEQIGKHGQLQEWLYDFDETEPEHRHLSHLIGFYPSCQITRRGTPELAAAVRKVLERRGQGSRGWSGAWKINLLARLGEGEQAKQLLDQMVGEISMVSFAEDSDRVPSMEGNQSIQGITAGVGEMLMQSHANEIELLPALPKDWPSGCVKGLRARGGFQVDITWDQGCLKRATIVSKIGGSCRLRCSSPLTVEAQGKPIAVTCVEPTVFAFDTQPGGVYVITSS